MKVIYTAVEMNAYIDMSLNVSKLAKYKENISKEDIVKELLNVKEVTHDEEGNWIIDIPEEKILKVIKLVNNNASTIITIFQSICSLLKVLKVNLKTMETDMKNIFKD
ncbi:MAG: hypothetical protein WC981_02825 [Candidatus Dojkabacteria bacterium]